MQKTLRKYSRDVGQKKAAKELGVTQGAISHALRTNRQIFVQQTEEGKVEAFEIRPFPHIPKKNVNEKEIKK